MRIVDIKSGTGQGAFSRSLAPQIRYYRWLWVGSFGEDPSVSGIEGWYLGSGQEVVPMEDGFDDASLLDILDAMNTIPLEASVFPEASVASTAQGVAPCEGDEGRLPLVCGEGGYGNPSDAPGTVVLHTARSHPFLARSLATHATHRLDPRTSQRPRVPPIPLGSDGQPSFRAGARRRARRRPTFCDGRGGGDRCTKRPA